MNSLLKPLNSLIILGLTLSLTSCGGSAALSPNSSGPRPKTPEQPIQPVTSLDRIAPELLQPRPKQDYLFAKKWCEKRDSLTEDLRHSVDTIIKQNLHVSELPSDLTCNEIEDRLENMIGIKEGEPWYAPYVLELRNNGDDLIDFAPLEDLSMTHFSIYKSTLDSFLFKKQLPDFSKMSSMVSVSFDSGISTRVLDYSRVTSSPWIKELQIAKANPLQLGLSNFSKMKGLKFFTITEANLPLKNLSCLQLKQLHFKYSLAESVMDLAALDPTDLEVLDIKLAGNLAYGGIDGTEMDGHFKAVDEASQINFGPTFARMAKLKTLILESAPANIFNSLTSLPAIETLEVRGYGSASLQPLSNLKTLKHLRVSKMPLNSIAGLSSLNQLEELSIWGLQKSASLSSDLDAVLVLPRLKSIQFNLPTGFEYSMEHFHRATSLEKLMIDGTYSPDAYPIEPSFRGIDGVLRDKNGIVIPETKDIPPPSFKIGNTASLSANLREIRLLGLRVDDPETLLNLMNRMKVLKLDGITIPKEKASFVTDFSANADRLNNKDLSISSTKLD